MARWENEAESKVIVLRGEKGSICEVIVDRKPLDHVLGGLC